MVFYELSPIENQFEQFEKYKKYDGASCWFPRHRCLKPKFNRNDFSKYDLKHGIGASENFTTTLTRAAMGPIGADLIQNTNVTTETSQGFFLGA